MFLNKISNLDCTEMFVLIITNLYMYVVLKNGLFQNKIYIVA